MDGNRVGSTIESLIDHRAMSLFQMRMVALIALAILLDGFDSNVLALAIPALSREWGLEPARFAIVSAVASGAMLVGAPLAGVLNDRVGRRWTLIGSTALYGFATLLASTAHDIRWLLFCRAASGVGLGGALVAATTSVSEHTPGAKQPFVVTVAVLGIPLGSMLAGVIATEVVEPYGWRGLFIIGGIAPLALALLYVLTLSETPHYLFRRQSARPALERYMSRTGAQLPAETLLMVPSIKEQRGNPLALVSGDLRRETLLIWLGTFSALLASYMMLNWLPVLYTQAGANAKMASASITWFGGGSLVGGVLAPLLVLRFGSRKVMVLAAALAAIFAGGLAMRFSTGPTALPVLFALTTMSVMFSLLNMLLYSILPSLYPDAIRGSGIGFAVGAGRIGAISSAYVGAWALGGGGTLFFGVAAVAALVAMTCYALVRRHAPPGL